MPVNIHNELTALGYTMDRGVLAFSSGCRYIAVVLDDADRLELEQTTDNARRMALTDMMRIRTELEPRALFQMYPADEKSTWYIAFRLSEQRRLDSFRYPVAAGNIFEVVSQFNSRGQGCSLQGAYWYWKRFPGYFTQNPHDDGQPGIQSLLQFIADEQDGLRAANFQPSLGLSQEIPETGEVFYYTPKNLRYTTSPSYQVYGSPTIQFISLTRAPEIPSPSPATPAEAETPAPNALGRKITLED